MSNLVSKKTFARKKHKLDIRTLEYSDIDLITSLQPTGWSDITPAIQFYTNSTFCFPIKATIDGKIVGIGTAIIHEDIAWLAHIIVHPENRNQGIGKLISQTLVESSHSKNCNTIYLIATDFGEPVYKKIGFETETEYLFFKGIKPNRSWTTSKNIISFTDQFKTQIINLDQQVSGEFRLVQLEQHLMNGFVFQQNNIIEGFYLPTFGEGLIIAKTNIAGLELMKLRLTAKENAAFPIDNLSATEFMRQNKFEKFKIAKRMRLGMKRLWHPTGIYNRIGGNLG